MSQLSMGTVYVPLGIINLVLIVLPIVRTIFAIVRPITVLQLLTVQSVKLGIICR